MKKSDIQIKRGDKVLKEIAPEKIPDQLDSGDLKPDDLYLDRLTDTWKSLSEWKQLPDGRRKFFPGTADSSFDKTPEPRQQAIAPIPAPEAEKRETPARRSTAKPTGVARFSADAETKVRRIETPAPEPAESDPIEEGADLPEEPLVKLDKRQLQRLHKTLLSWLVAVFFLLIAFGFWVYSRNLGEQLTKAENEILGLRDSVASQNSAIETLNSLTPAGTIRCMVTYDPAPGQVVGMINVTVLLFPREAVEKAMRAQGLTNLTVSDSTYQESIRKLKSALPSPAAVSLTNSSGRAELSIPSNGQYVLVCMPTRKINGISSQFLWLIGFEARNQPSNGILLSSENAVSPANPKFEIHQVLAPAQNAYTP